MATSRQPNGSGSTGPTVDDCNRLWTTLKTELITDLEIRIDFQLYPNPSDRPYITVRSPGFEPTTGLQRWHIWARKELDRHAVAISYKQLFDLLIAAHHRIEQHLGGQQPMPLL